MSGSNIDPTPSIDSCVSQLRYWRPFEPPTTAAAASSLRNRKKKKNKKECPCLSIEALDLSKMNLSDVVCKLPAKRRMFKRKRRTESLLLSRWLAEFHGNTKKNIKNKNGGETIELGDIHIDSQEEESGYGSEPDYRADAEWI